MIRFSKTQRMALGETLRQLANLVVGALVVGQFVRQQAPSFWLALAGIGVWCLLVAIALRLLGEKADGPDG